MRSEAEATRALDRYADTVRRICLVYLKSHADTEDIFQTVFLKYVLSAAVFENEQHERAWFIRVTVNACKDLLKSVFRRRVCSLDEALTQAAPTATEEARAVLTAVLSLPEKYRLPVYLHYYEGYTAAEIGGLLHRNVQTIYTRLARGRGLLREALGGEDIG